MGNIKVILVFLLMSIFLGCNSDVLTQTKDNTAPIITLIGNSKITIKQGEPYTDAGAKATDNTDGDITTNITINNPVNIAILGRYIVTYNVSDIANNKATQVTRTVTVIENTNILSTPTNLTATTNSSSQINLSWITSTDNVGVIGYKIYRDGSQIATTTNTSYTDTGLTAQTTYSYRISAYDAAENNSNQSSQTQATTHQAGSTVLLAFPGAEGFGANSIGGRGGTIVKVTNLNDSGSGSFREAVYTNPRHYANGSGSRYKYESEDVYEARLDNEGRKTVVFEVSGIINLMSTLNIDMPYLTIAGETSPGGVMITGAQTNIRNHDVIIRHMRFRVGSHNIANGADPEKLDSLSIVGKYWGGVNADNIIIDHSSFGWGVDETLSVTGGVTNSTIQWSTITEGLSRAGHPKGEHSKGLMISGKYVYPSSISIHHNYIAHNNDRNPLVYSPADVDVLADVVNNVIYNWKGGLSPSGGGAAKINWDNNYVRQGSNSNSYSFEVILGDINIDPTPLMYVYGNVGSTRLNQSDPQWNVGFGWKNELLDEEWRRLTKWTVPNVITSVMTEAVANDILIKVGATAPVRDSVDARVIADFATGTGNIRDNVTYPDDFPTFQNITPPTDSDNDGMADSWEISTFGNISKTNNEDEDGDGYTNIEEYLHYLAE